MPSAHSTGIRRFTRCTIQHDDGLEQGAALRVAAPYLSATDLNGGALAGWPVIWLNGYLPPAASDEHEIASGHGLDRAGFSRLPWSSLAASARGRCPPTWVI